MANSVLAIGLFISGVGHLLPRWTTVIGTNLLLLSASPIIYAGFKAWIAQTPVKLGNWEWGIVLLTVPAFWYWGLIQPNGIYRSVVFSFAEMCMNAPVAILLFTVGKKHARRKLIFAIALLFAVVTVWMAARGISLLFSEIPSQPSSRGANPTNWLTVFWFIIILTMTTLFVMWLEIDVQNPPIAQSKKSLSRFVEYFRRKILFLWTIVIILFCVVISEVGVAYVNFQRIERTNMFSSAEIINESFAIQTIGLVNQINVILEMVEMLQNQLGKNNTALFIKTLRFKPLSLHKICIFDIQGKLQASNSKTECTLSNDFLSSIENTTDNKSLILKKQNQNYLWIKRIYDTQHTVVGFVTLVMELEQFKNFYHYLVDNTEFFIALQGNHDFLQINMNLLFQEVQLPKFLSDAGFKAEEDLNFQQNYYYVLKEIPLLPLVMITGFSQAQLDQKIHYQTRWLFISSLLFIFIMLTLALLLSLEIKRRNEQESFTAMLSHEIKTPISVISMALSISELPTATKNRVTRSITDITSVIERCLLSDRLEYGFIEPHFAFYQIKNVLKDIQSNCFEPERLKLSIEPLPICRTDEQLLRMIITNLVDNALKYGANNCPIFIDAKVILYKKQAGIVISVTNESGIAGIPDSKKVFKKYYRTSGAHGKTGSGLGLHIAQGMAHQLGGEIRFKPVNNTVCFELWMRV
ncbi:MAG: HAMP domain-containing sensor histidine kinase [Methylococcales bacterium]|nr:HAMP domain-containing sensor histidine kinase [Methylococcales bacterium]